MTFATENSEKFKKEHRKNRGNEKVFASLKKITKSNIFSILDLP